MIENRKCIREYVANISVEVSNRAADQMKRTLSPGELCQKFPIYFRSKEGDVKFPRRKQ